MPFQVATFNAGLAVGVLPYATERVPRVVEALDVDLLFVQEFWLDAHWDRLRRALGAEQPPQLDRLLAWIDEKAGGAPALLLGDLNTTPGSSLFRRLESAGFRDADVPDRRGTFSHDGLGTGDVVDSGWRLDHVLLRGLDAALRADRVLDEPVTISAAGRPVRTTLSDHFGVLATVERR